MTDEEKIVDTSNDNYIDWILENTKGKDFSITEEWKNYLRQEIILSNATFFTKWKIDNKLLLDQFLIDWLTDIITRKKLHEPNS